MTIRRPFQLLFLAFVAAGIYYPTIFAPELTVDDARMLTALINTDRVDLIPLFFPTVGVYYYRPLLGLTFYADRFFFFCHPAIMHFENILLHVGNSCLLFWFARQVVTNGNSKGDAPNSNTSFLPLLIALFFAVHPLTTEPVNWISGRTDLLAGFFTLLALNLFWYNRCGPERWPIDWLAAFCLLLGLFGKEVAAAGLMIVVASLFWRGLNFAVSAWRQRLRILLPYCATIWLYFALRSGSFLALDNGVRSAITGTKGAEHFTLWIKATILLKALGFYATKIIWPLPLNFAIVQVNTPLSITVGILTLGLIALLLYRRQGAPSFLLVSASCFISPALLVATSKMAWTPLAERYLYIPLMFFSCAMLLIGQRLPKKLGIFLLTLILSGFSWATVSRNLVWQNNLTLFEDVVRKSPTFAAGHNEYAVALARAGKTEQAKKQFAIAAKLSQGTMQQLSKANLAWLSETSPENFLTSADSLLADSSSPLATQDLLTATVNRIDRLLLESNDAAARRRLTEKNIELLERLYTLTPNPFALYRQGQLYLSLGAKKEAEEHFAEACRRSNDYYTKPACKLADDLKKERSGK